MLRRLSLLVGIAVLSSLLPLWEQAWAVTNGLEGATLSPESVATGAFATTTSGTELTLGGVADVSQRIGFGLPTPSESLGESESLQNGFTTYTEEWTVVEEMPKGITRGGSRELVR